MKKFELPALKYPYNAFEPFIDAKTMEIHHQRHHQAYIDNLNKAIEKLNLPVDFSFYQLLQNISEYPVAVKNNAGGHYNHSLFWNQLLPPAQNQPNLANAESGDHSTTKPQPELETAIINAFGSINEFKVKFSEAAASRFGSGWVWLIVSDHDHQLKITTTANQDNPLMNLPEVIHGLPIIALDVWEHAYYLKYQNKRPEYVNAFWNLLNWEFAEQNYLSAK